MNQVTLLFHGLKASQNFVKLIKGQVEAGRLRLSECEIELENGKIHKFSPEEYIALAEASLNHVIDGIKKGEENRQGRRGGLAS